MPPRTLAAFIKARMRAMQTDTVQIERDYPDLPNDWIRGLLIGRGVKQPNRARIKRLAVALDCEEAVLWRYLGRFDEISRLRGEPPATDQMPEWARRLEEKVDALTELIRSVRNRVDGSGEGIASVLALMTQANDHQHGKTQGGPAGPPRPARRRRAPRVNGGTK